MDKISVLHIGIKNWPYNNAFNTNNKRGGGMNKYCDLLINAYADKVESFVITQNVGQKKYEKYESGIKVFRVKTFGGRKVRLLYLNLVSFFIAIKVIRKYKINIVHGHILTGIITSYLLSRIFRIPVVGTPYNIYNNIHKFPLSLISRNLEKSFYSHVDKLVFESEENRDRAIRMLKRDFKNSLAINTGIELPKRVPGNSINQIPIKVLFIGRLVKVKALDNLILSFKYLSQEIKEKIQLDIIGEGEEFAYLKSIQKEEKLEKHIRIHGFVDDLNSYVEQANIFILPSHTEGLSIALLEAMSNGLACIVNNYGVPFSDKEVFTMTDNKPETIADALTKFVLNPDMIKFYRDNAITVIEKEFSVEAFASKYFTVYKKLIN